MSVGTNEYTVKPGRYPANWSEPSKLDDLTERVAALESAAKSPPSALWKSEVERLKLDRADQANTIIALLQEKSEMAATIAELRESRDKWRSMAEANR